MKIVNFFLVSSLMFVSFPSLAKKKAKVVVDKKQVTTLSVKLGEEKKASQGFVVKYAYQDHEHVSSGPGQPFSASVGVHFFEFSKDGVVTKMTYYSNAEGVANSKQDYLKYSIELVNVESKTKIANLKITNL